MDPSSIALLVSALMAAYGTYSQYQGRQAVDKRQHDLASAEALRQKAFDDQRAQEIAAHQGQMTREAQGQEQQSIAQNVAQYLAPSSPTSATTEYVAQGAGDPQEIKDRRDAALAGAAEKGKSYASRLGQLSSLKLLNFNNAVGLNRLGERVGAANANSLRSSEILPMELQFSTLAGRGDQTRADIANGIGSIAMMYGLTASPSPSGTPTGGGGSGITMPESTGYDRAFPDRTGLKVPTAGTPSSGQGMRVPRLVY